jgi:hypothetical protein
VAPIFHGRKPATDAQVESTFSLMLSADLASMFMMGAAVHVAAGGGAAPASLDPQLLSGEPATMQATSPAAAQTPWLHHDASVCCVRFGHGTQTGAQSVGLVQVSPAAPDFQGKSPTTDAQVVSTFSPTLSTEFASVAVTGVPVQVAAGGMLAPLPAAPPSTGGKRLLPFPHAISKQARLTNPTSPKPHPRSVPISAF